MSKRRVAFSGSVQNPVFRYTSTCCSAPAEKPPLLMPKGRHIGFPGARPEAEGTLGSWRCTSCRKSCSVSRSKNKQEETAVAA